MPFLRHYCRHFQSHIVSFPVTCYTWRSCVGNTRDVQTFNVYWLCTEPQENRDEAVINCPEASRIAPTSRAWFQHEGKNGTELFITDTVLHDQQSVRSYTWPTLLTWLNLKTRPQLLHMIASFNPLTKMVKTCVMNVQSRSVLLKEM